MNIIRRNCAKQLYSSFQFSNIPVLSSKEQVCKVCCKVLGRFSSSSSCTPDSSVVQKWRGRPPKAVLVLTPSSSIAPSSVWSWVPPSNLSDSATIREGDEVIEVIEGKLLTSEEIRDALVRMGGEDVMVVKLLEKLDTISELVIVTGRSIRQIRKLANMVVHALKSRNLVQALGITGAEGGKEDDWLLVDCHNCVVHFMLPSTRVELDLESHWGKLNQAQRSAIYKHEEED